MWQFLYTVFVLFPFFQSQIPCTAKQPLQAGKSFRRQRHLSDRTLFKSKKHSRGRQLQALPPSGMISQTEFL